MKALKECPVCHSKKLEQEFQSTTHWDGRIGGPHTSSPDALDGCHCKDCSTVFKANVAGKCPICKGTGRMKFVHYGGSYDHVGSTSEEKCWGCEGVGVIK